MEQITAVTYSQPAPSFQPDLVQAADIADNTDVEHVVVQIRKELDSLHLEHAAIVKRIALIKQTLHGLAGVFGERMVNGQLQNLLSLSSVPPPSGASRGLTQSCRRLLAEAQSPVTVHQIHAGIQERYPEVLANNKKPTASLQVILRRLVEYGEAEAGFDARGKRTWRSKSRQAASPPQENRPL
ncbi:MAG TPA: hypothetical protein VMH85_08715 [Terriglobales bacterium]|nr:hypothetical protein [Terriglobales bacterium]